jgi:O-acetyl-ADP-ribose deacetylase
MERGVGTGGVASWPASAIIAANQHLGGGGGVDGAIHRAGGEAIMAETRERYPDGCPAGGAVTTGAGRMKAKWVIHAVGPRWRDGRHGEEELLAGAWRTALGQAIEHGAWSVALPSIATGVYGFPVDRAARIAVREVRPALAAGSGLQVTICTFSAGDEEVYRRAVEETSQAVGA